MQFPLLNSIRPQCIVMLAAGSLLVLVSEVLAPEPLGLSERELAAFDEALRAPGFSSESADGTSLLQRPVRSALPARPSSVAAAAVSHPSLPDVGKNETDHVNSTGAAAALLGWPWHVPKIEVKVPEIHMENLTAADVVHVKGNAFGDIIVFAQSLAVAAASILILCIIFCLLRTRFPEVYGYNALPQSEPPSASEQVQRQPSERVVRATSTAGGRSRRFPPVPANTMMGWIAPTLRLSIDDVEHNVSLDAAMLLEFTHLCMKLCCVIGLPMCLIMAPVNYWFGGNERRAVDRLSRIGMANVRFDSSLYWLHAIVVVLVIVLSQGLLDSALRGFLARRFRWLKSMPAPRSTTILIENLPERHRSDVALKSYFAEMFSKESIKEAYVVRRTDRLLQLLPQLSAAELRLAEAERQAAEPDAAPPTMLGLGGTSVDAVEYWQARVEELRGLAKEERDRLTTAAAAEGPGIDSDRTALATTGFVTFHRRRDAEVALRLDYRADVDELSTAIPPDPSDVRWQDLRGSAAGLATSEFVGHLCMLGLYIGFLPLIVAISSAVNMQQLQAVSPAIRSLLEKHPELSGLLQGVLASFALTLFMSFLPTMIMCILDRFFVLKSSCFAQHKLQNWYFWFQVVYILLCTAIGNSIFRVLELLVKTPSAAPGLLADTMPQASHFYLNFLVMQWTTHFLNLTRYVQLVKYLALAPSAASSEALRDLVEPEDQDYYGFGSRSARFAINMCIALVFCTLSPLMCILALINFCICRLVYGYLLVYAETRKPDQGGVFFFTQLHHLRAGLFIFALLMLGVLARRSEGVGPPSVVFCGFLYLLLSGRLYKVQWETLPFEEVVCDHAVQKRSTSQAAYVQSEMTEPSLDG